MKKALLIFAGILCFCVIVFIVLVLRPIYNVTLEDSIKVSGEVSMIFENGKSYDISFRLKGDSNFYYINRGAQNGLDALALNDSLQNKKITLYYADHWTPLDPKGRVRHITRVLYNEQLLYDEIKE